MSDPASFEEARRLVGEAQELHSKGKIDAAIEAARSAIDLAADFVPAYTYLGTTLITRRLQFAEGLDYLYRAVELAPEDAGVVYSLGWCEEFVAYRLEKLGRNPYRDPYELYDLASTHLQRCIDLNPEQGLKDDAQDLKDSIERRLG